MKEQITTVKTKLRVTGLLVLVTSISLQASPIKWEIHQAFPSWVEGESWLAYLKITNTGEEIIPLSGNPTAPEMEQILLVPKWRKGTEPHNHGHRTHSHHQPQSMIPWASNLAWKGAPLIVLQDHSRALKPSESEVIGNLGLRSLSANYSLPDKHIESFQFALRLGQDRYVLSESQKWLIADIPELEKHPVASEIQSFVKGYGKYSIPIRQIEIDGEQWLFQGRFRIARVPKDATPRFHLENVPGESIGTGNDEEEVLVIEFDGVEEETVRILVRQALPLSGSKRTVPHLHLWRSLTDRSMFEYAGTEGGFFKESGLTLEQAQKLKWDGTDPELKVKQTKDGE